jgi:hypothetical protein
MKAAKAISINREKHLRAIPSRKTSLKSTIMDRFDEPANTKKI